MNKSLLGVKEFKDKIFIVYKEIQAAEAPVVNWYPQNEVCSEDLYTFPFYIGNKQMPRSPIAR